MDLATMLAQGATAEGLVRAVLTHLDAEWSEHLTTYGDPAITAHDRDVAYGRLLAIHPPRAVLSAAVELWDRQAPTPAKVVHIGERPAP